jgi:hypothetical protein
MKTKISNIKTLKHSIKIENLKFKIIFLLLISYFLFLISAPAAAAQESIRAFTISPPAIEVRLSPGEKTEGVLKIINDSSEPLTFTTTMQDFIVKDNIGTPQILPPDTLSNKYSGAKWVAVYPSTVTVAPHKSEKLNYYIQVPSDARPGGRYAAIVYTPISTIAVKGTGASVQTSVGTLFYVTVKGPVNESASVSGFKAPGLVENGPVNISTQITNLSDIHITPQAKITLTNLFGGKSDQVSLAKYNIFPEAARNYENKIGKGFMFGPYKANLAGVYGTASLPLAASVSFWVIPWRLILFIIFLVVAISVGYWYLRRRTPVKLTE